MDLRKMHEKAKRLLVQWDPFDMKQEQAYETEIVDVLLALEQMEHDHLLAKHIQSIYEHSYEQNIPLPQCEQMVKQLRTLQKQVTCTL